MDHETEKRFSKKSVLKWRKQIVGVLAVVIIGGVGFYSGVAYQKHHTTNASNNLPTTASAGQGFGSGGFSGARSGGSQRSDRIIGQVSAISSSSISVQTQTGSTTTLAITSSTTITENGQTVSASSIQSGDTVFVTEDTSNTSQAARIMVNPSSSDDQSQTQAQAE
jgi:hypothetical protein